MRQDLLSLVRELDARLPSMVHFIELHATYCEYICAKTELASHTPRCKMLCERYGFTPATPKDSALDGYPNRS